jgi:hypothetical protein
MQLMKFRTFSIVGVLTVGVAYAAQITYVGSSITGPKLFLNVSSSGLPVGDRINLKATATAQVTYGCMNKAGNVLKDRKKQLTLTKTVSRSGSFRNQGAGTQSPLFLNPPPAGSFKCPPGLEVAILEVHYRNVVVTDAAHHIIKRIPHEFSNNLHTVK